MWACESAWHFWQQPLVETRMLFPSPPICPSLSSTLQHDTSTQHAATTRGCQIALGSSRNDFETQPEERKGETKLTSRRRFSTMFRPGGALRVTISLKILTCFGKPQQPEWVILSVTPLPPTAPPPTLPDEEDDAVLSAAALDLSFAPAIAQPWLDSPSIFMFIRGRGILSPQRTFPSLLDSPVPDWSLKPAVASSCFATSTNRSQPAPL
jgi:hypothetical protein